MTKEEMAKIIEAEASVLPYYGKLAVAQCIKDNNYNAKAFTKPSESYSADSLKAAEEVLEHGKNRLENAEILQIRSFKNYSDGNMNPDWNKLKSGVAPIPDDYSYLGEDHLNAEWGHFYFGKVKEMKNFKMLLIAGHGDGDPGACGCGLKEADLTRELVSLIKKAADAVGVSCVIADTSRNYYKYLKNGGSYDFKPYNYVLEVHFNHRAQNGDSAMDNVVSGSMFYLHQNEKEHHSVEDKILANLYALGSKKAWDGVVMSTAAYDGGLLVQNRVEGQGVSHALLETLFISDPDDMKLYAAKKSAIASAIISGIVSGFGLNTTAPTPIKFKEYMVRVKITDLNIRTGAGTNYASVGCIPVGSYTITEEAAGNGASKWGKLKSGAGWISLDFVEKV